MRDALKIKKRLDFLGIYAMIDVMIFKIESV